VNGVKVEIGASLREARCRLGLELSEVEAATLIRARYLDALEHERFDDLPSGSYRVVFLREYAEFLGLDGRILADEYLLRSAPVAAEPRPRAPFGAGAASVLDRVSKVHVAGVAALVLFGIAVWQLGSGGGGTPARTRTVATSPPPATSLPPDRPRPRRRAHEPPVHRPVRPPAPRAVLVLAAERGSCWLLVRRGSSSGAVIFERTLAPGQRVRFGVRKPLWIRIGAPWNLDASLRGRNIARELPPVTANVVVTAGGVRRV